MNKVINIIFIAFILSCGQTKSKNENGKNNYFILKEIIGKTLLFNNGVKINTSLFNLRYITQLSTERHGAYIVVSGKASFTISITAKYKLTICI